MLCKYLCNFVPFPERCILKCDDRRKLIIASDLPVSILKILVSNRDAFLDPSATFLLTVIINIFCELHFPVAGYISLTFKNRASYI